MCADEAREGEGTAEGRTGGCWWLCAAPCPASRRDPDTLVAADGCAPRCGGGAVVGEAEAEAAEEEEEEAEAEEEAEEEEEEEEGVRGEDDGNDDGPDLDSSWPESS